MSMSNEMELQMSALLFNNTNAANWGDTTGLRGSSAAGNLYLAPHTADPGETGDQTTSEAAYTSHNRVAIPRDGSIIDGTVNPAVTLSDVSWAAATGGTETLTHFSFGSASSGAGHRFISGTLTPNVSIVSGVTPILKQGSSITFD